MSKTDESALEACATTNGKQVRPGSAGSLRSRKGRGARTSPTLVRPCGAENTVPALLGFLTAGRTHQPDHQVGHGLGREDHLVPAGVEVDAPCPPGQPAHQPFLQLSDGDVGEVGGA